MKKELKCVMLVDDDQNDNFFHKREINKNNSEINVLTKTSGLEAIHYLKSMKQDQEIRPDLVFLDINMPVMNGWEFLKEFSLLDKEIRSGIIVMMLTSSMNPADETRAKSWDFVSEYFNKPLNKIMFADIVGKYFGQ